jgi:FtsP/CotA-like multicopper oxidase with cupredoxin domain
MTSRRQFLKYIPCAFVVTKYNAVLADNKNVINYKITAKKTSFSFKDNTSAELLLYNDTNPGPTLKGNVGDILRVNFTNNLDEPTSIHWHGIKNINKMDGVPYLTQDPIQPGETFVYEFPLNHSGTYWYHAHMDSWKQVAKGLYGPLVISNLKENIFDDDLVILADDWRLNKNYEIDEKSFGSLMDWSHAGRIGNWLTINGKKSPEYQIKKDGLTRLRFINASNARVLKFGSSLKKMEIIAVDGMSVKPFFQEFLTLAPGQRIDISVRTNHLSEVNFFEISQKKSLNAFLLKTIKSNQITKKKTFNFASKSSLPSLANAKIIQIHMQGGAMGNLAKAEFDGVDKRLQNSCNRG